MAAKAPKAPTSPTPKKGAAVKRPGTARNTAAPKGVAWHAAFVAELADSCNVTNAARAAGISRDTAYEHRKDDPAFAAAWEDAIEQAVEKLEYAARQRALTISDTLAIFLLKAHRPKVYRENVSVEHSGPAGGPIPIREVIIERTAGADE